MIKKTHPRFRVPNLNSKSRSGIKDRWRAQRGIDNKMRYKKKGHGAMPNIGYKNSAEISGRRPDGMFEKLVHNKAELIELSNNKDYVARFSHSLSKRSRIDMQKIAEEHNIRVVNRVQ
jgi:ribosomal protein L32E